ncbi:MAG: GNAT family N-acetyltransferase [Bacillota bacterium]|nr:MAG: hypothetical protein DIU70_12050 [Bacillota bacterium]
MVEYRAARPEDLPALLPLVEAFARERAAAQGHQVLRPDFMEHARAGMEQALAHPAAFVILAEEQGEPVGYGVGTLQEPPPPFEPRPYIFISDLYVRPDRRGQGIGTALVERIRGWGLVKGVYRLSMVVPLSIPAAVRLGARLGFRPVEQLLFWQDPSDE